MAERDSKEEMKLRRRFMKNIENAWKEQKKRDEDAFKKDKLYETRQVKANNIQVDIRNRTFDLIKQNRDWHKNQSQATRQQYLAGLKTIESLKSISAKTSLGVENSIKFFTDSKERHSMITQTWRHIRMDTRNGFENLGNTMKKNREAMVATIQRSPEMIVGGIVKGVENSVRGMKEGLALKHDKLLAYFGNKDARERAEKAMEKRKAKGGFLGSDASKDIVEKGKGIFGWLKKLMGGVLSLGTTAFKGLFTTVFPAIGKFLLRNIGKLGILGLATGLIATFWDDISDFLGGLWTGKGEGLGKVTESGVSDMLQKLFGFVNDGIKAIFGVDLGKKMEENGLDIKVISDTIAEYVTPIINGFTEVANALGTGFKKIYQDAFGVEGKPGKMTEFLGNMKEFAKSIISAVDEFTGGIFKDENGQPKSLGEITGMFMDKFRDFANMIMDAAVRVSEYFLNPSLALEDLKRGFSKVGDIVGNVFTDMKLMLSAWAGTLFSDKSYEELLAEKKKEDAKENEKLAERERVKISAELKSRNVNFDAMGITGESDTGQLEKRLLEAGYTDQQATRMIGKVNTLQNRLRRVEEQNFEALEVGIEGEVEKQQEQFLKDKRGSAAALKSDFMKGKLTQLMGNNKIYATKSGHVFGRGRFQENLIKMLQEMPDAERQKFLTAAQTLGDGPTGSAEASKLMSQMGLNFRDMIDTSGIDSRKRLDKFAQDNLAKDFIEVLREAETLRISADGKDTYKDMYRDSIDDDAAERLLLNSFTADTDKIVKNLSAIHGQNQQMIQYVVESVQGIPRTTGLAVANSVEKRPLEVGPQENSQKNLTR
tara:strand:+ start:2125 stop:4599 length:2475 start_codon:yes stop_codon:yes gene_type:complete